mgnify:CR=1 FL=1
MSAEGAATGDWDAAMHNSWRSKRSRQPDLKSGEDVRGIESQTSTATGDADMEPQGRQEHRAGSQVSCRWRSMLVLRKNGTCKGPVQPQEQGLRVLWQARAHDGCLQEHISVPAWEGCGQQTAAATAAAAAQGAACNKHRGEIICCCSRKQPSAVDVRLMHCILLRSQGCEVQSQRLPGETSSRGRARTGACHGPSVHKVPTPPARRAACGCGVHRPVRRRGQDGGGGRVGVAPGCARVRSDHTMLVDS